MDLKEKLDHLSPPFMLDLHQSSPRYSVDVVQDLFFRKETSSKVSGS